MVNLLKSYLLLLEAYTKQVRNLEQEKTEMEKLHPGIGSVPYKAINSRFFTPDAILNNTFNRGMYYEDKKVVMPYLVSFMADFEKATDEERQALEDSKNGSVYEMYLDELVKQAVPFEAFLESQLRQYRLKENHLQSPYPPQRRNATSQWAKYEKDRVEYEEKLSTIKNCINELETRIQLFKELSRN